MTRNKLLLKLYSLSSNSDKDFQEIIIAVLDNGLLTENDLRRELCASKPTIRRWKEGKSSPHPFMRPIFLDISLKNFRSSNN